MKTATTSRADRTREKIIDTANDLFYRQGYQATVVNQIIEAAGVSKPTFYAHFPSKEDLCVTYLDTKRELDLRNMKVEVRRQQTPFKRFMAPMHLVKGRMEETDYRGCGFFNMLVEVADPKSRIAQAVRRFNDELRALLKDLTGELVRSDARYAHLDVDRVADAYYLILAGAIAFAQEYQASWPLDLAIEQVAGLAG